jgi:hypothetical protein
MESNAFPLGSDEEANRIDVSEGHFVQVKRRRGATCGDLRAHVLDVFRPHTADQANRGPVFADVGDDPRVMGATRQSRGGRNWQSLPRLCAE